MITHDQEQKLRGWFAGRLPDGVYTELTEVIVDREEITVVGRIPVPSLDSSPDAIEGRISEFRERTREQRMEAAREAEQRFGKKVAWGVQCGDTRAVFTNISAPVMTRLRQPERVVLDTLVAGGVARSRSDALAWCVKLVHQHADTWLADLRQSLAQVQQVRAAGPDVASPTT